MIPRFDFNYTTWDFVCEIKYSSRKLKTYLTPLQNYYGGFPLIFVGKARVGIRMALNALELNPGSAIGVQPFTCSSVLFAIKMAGFKIIFIDIDQNFRMSHEDLRIKSHFIDALIVTHTFGFPENLEIIKSILGFKPIIEDCAQAFLSEHNGIPLGLSGDAGIFSIGYGKLFGIGNGGYIISKKSSVHSNLIKESEKLKYPSGTYNWKERIRSLMLGVLYKPVVYNALTYSLKKSMNKKKISIQKYPKTEQLLSLSRILQFAEKFGENVRKVQRQQENGKMLVKLVEKRFHPITPLDGTTPNYFLFPLQSKKRDIIIKFLAGKGIEAGKHFSNSIRWVQAFGYTDGECPEFERIAAEVFTLPCHHYLPEEKIRYIAASLNTFHEE